MSVGTGGPMGVGDGSFGDRVVGTLPDRRCCKVDLGVTAVDGAPNDHFRKRTRFLSNFPLKTGLLGKRLTTLPRAVLTFKPVPMTSWNVKYYHRTDSIICKLKKWDSVIIKRK